MTGQFVAFGALYNTKILGDNYPFVLLKEDSVGVVLDVFHADGNIIRSIILNRELFKCDVIIDAGAYQFGVSRLSLKRWRNYKFLSGESAVSNLIKLTLHDSSVIITVVNNYFLSKLLDIADKNSKIKLEIVEKPSMSSKEVIPESFEAVNSGDVPRYLRRR